jgi:alpha-beta hydrolase superfamily lysophospholipase
VPELLKIFDPELKTETFYDYYPAENPRANLILIHGMGAATTRWAAAAEYFEAQGINVFCLSLKGYGKTPTATPGHIASFKDYYQDLRALLSQAKKVSNMPTFAMGESLGALIALGFERYAPKLFEGIIVLAPALQDKLSISIFKKLKLVSLLLINPKFPFPMPWNPEMITRDAQAIQIIKADPFEQHHVASPKMLLENILTRSAVMAQAKKFTTPVLVLQGGHDALMDYRAAEKFSKNLGKFGTYRFYPEMYHALSVDHGKEKVFADSLQWIDQTIAHHKI